MIDKIIKATELLNEVDNEIETLPEQQSNYDLSLSDLYHILEDNKLNAVQCCTFVKEMQRVVKERRMVKDKIEIGKIYKTKIMRLNNQNNRQLFIAEIKKMEKQLSNKYKNRVYSDDELIEKGIMK